MFGRVYVSAGAASRKRIQSTMPRKYQVIFTDNVQDADYLIVVKESEELTNEQFQEVVIAKENGARIKYIDDVKKVSQIQNTRKKFDMEIE